MELEDANCWTLAEAIGHTAPHRLQHLLSRASWDERAVLDATAAWAVAQLDDGDAVLIADETGDAKSSADAAGAAPQYSGSLGGVGLCQVAVHLTFATSRGHAIIDRTLYLPEAWAAAEERRELAGVLEELAFATKPAQAAAMLAKAYAADIRAAFFTGDGLRVARPAPHLPHPGPGVCGRGPHRPSRRPCQKRRDLQRRPQPAAGARLAADAHRHRLQGRARLRLGDARGGRRRHLLSWSPRARR
jgi:hypothetical protein